MLSDICTGIEDRGPHSVDLGENECPRCRITELEAEAKEQDLYRTQDTDRILLLRKRLDAVKACKQYPIKVPPEPKMVMLVSDVLEAIGEQSDE